MSSEEPYSPQSPDQLMTPCPSRPWAPVLLHERSAPKAHRSYGAGRASRQIPKRQRTLPRPVGCPPGDLGRGGACGRKAGSLGASPPFAGNEANVVGLAVRVNPPCLPPLLVTGIDDVQHVPKVEAEGLAQEPAVLGLVVVKQGPGGQVATGQSLAEDPGHRGPARRSGAGA